MNLRITSEIEHIFIEIFCKGLIYTSDKVERLVHMSDILWTGLKLRFLNSTFFPHVNKFFNALDALSYITMYHITYQFEDLRIYWSKCL